MDEFKVRCTESCDHRFIKGKIYSFDKTGGLMDELGNTGSHLYTGDFERGYMACKWHRYAFEPVKDLRTVVIHTDGETTTAILKDGKTVVKRTTARCSAGDKFDFSVGARLAFDRLMAEDKPAPKLYNGKVICIRAGVFHTVGKIYTVKNGLLDDDTGGEPYNANHPVCGLQELNALCVCKFIEYKGGLE